jgi:hypothetical protein
MVGGQTTDHLERRGSPLVLREAGESRQLTVRAGSEWPEGTDPLRDLVGRIAQIDVLLLEEQVQSSEVWAGHVPVIALRLHGEGVRIGQEPRELVRDAGNGRLGRRGSWLDGHEMFSDAVMP